MESDRLVWDLLIKKYVQHCTEGLSDICGDTQGLWFPNIENEHQVEQVHIVWPCQHDKCHNQTLLPDPQKSTAREAAQVYHGMPFPKLLHQSVMVA